MFLTALVRTVVVILCGALAGCGTQQPKAFVPFVDPQTDRAKIYEEGYRELQWLAEHERNEHLAFFIEWGDGTYSWGRWVEGTPLWVEFDSAWAEDLCAFKVRRLTIAHTHTINVPPSELDVALTQEMSRILNSCGMQVRALVVSPNTTWMLEMVADQKAMQGCGAYRHLWRVGAEYSQEDIDRLAKKQRSLLPSYYRCAQGIRAHWFETNPSASPR